MEAEGPFAVRVRMYNVGFGDCFLLTFPAPDRPRKVLIDCGKHTLSSGGPPLDRIVRQLLDDVTEVDGPRIDVVVATHRHRDHVQGFAADGWQDVSVDEVWMPWTEDPDDSEARDVCARQSRKAKQLKRRVHALAMDAERDYLLGYASNSLTNAAAMNRLHGGFRGSPVRRFLPATEEARNHFQPGVLPGVEVYVLGPPRDPEVMREMEPPAAESFLWAGKDGGKAADAPPPFADQFTLTRAEYAERTGQTLDEDFPAESEKWIGQVSDDPAFELLARLEAAVNSTSLVLLFHVGDAWLLFPGDAQWGTWNAILQHPTHSRLLENLTFYKVGHHGSHNATPISFVDRYVKSHVRVMLPYGTVEHWPTIPRQGLLTAFAGKNVAVARSDQAPAAGGPFQARQENGDVLYIDMEVPLRR